MSTHGVKTIVDGGKKVRLVTFNQLTTWIDPKGFLANWGLNIWAPAMQFKGPVMAVQYFTMNQGDEFSEWMNECTKLYGYIEHLDMYSGVDFTGLSGNYWVGWQEFEGFEGYIEHFIWEEHGTCFAKTKAEREYHGRLRVGQWKGEYFPSIILMPKGNGRDYPHIVSVPEHKTGFLRAAQRYARKVYGTSEYVAWRESVVGQPEKKRRHRCDNCGLVKDSVKKREDPFLAEVHDQKVEKWLCDECYQDKADDV